MQKAVEAHMENPPMEQVIASTDKIPPKVTKIIAQKGNNSFHGLE